MVLIWTHFDYGFVFYCGFDVADDEFGPVAIHCSSTTSRARQDLSVDSGVVLSRHT